MKQINIFNQLLDNHNQQSQWAQNKNTKLQNCEHREREREREIIPVAKKGVKRESEGGRVIWPTLV